MALKRLSVSTRYPQHLLLAASFAVIMNESVQLGWARKMQMSLIDPNLKIYTMGSGDPKEVAQKLRALALLFQRPRFFPSALIRQLKTTSNSALGVLDPFSDLCGHCTYAIHMQSSRYTHTHRSIKVKM